ncbi:MAG: Zn-ribbon domain-containing OB-fold protein [Lacisediminihabitans sp.]
MADYRKPIPQATPETQDFWDGAKEGNLRLQRCKDCSDVYFPPRPFCPKCSSRNVESFTASGKGRLYSYVINHRPAPGFEADAPYAIAVVELNEGPRMMTSITGVEQTPEALPLDMALEVNFEAVSDKISLPKFKPSAGGAK